MTPILLIGSGFLGLIAAVGAWLSGGGLFLSLLCYAVVGNLIFSVLSYWLFPADEQKRQNRLEREINADLMAILDDQRRQSAQEFMAREAALFPELRRQAAERSHIPASNRALFRAR